MGIAVGSSKTGLASEPNIVPLIDVLLVLIIIFMVIAPRIPTGLPALVPQPAAQARKSRQPDAVVVQIMQGGKIMINDEQNTWDTLGP